MRRFGRSVAACAGASFFAACGGSAAVSLGGPNATFDGVVVLGRATVVATDVDGDGAGDVVAFDREGRGDAKAWRNVRDDYVPAPESWTSGAALRAVRDSCDVMDDAALEADFGVHRADVPNRARVAYAVLHVGDGAQAVLGPPALSEAEPAAAPVHALVALEGTDLAARGEETTVDFGAERARVLFAFPDRLFVLVPGGLVPGPTSVVVRRGTEASEPLPFTVAATPAPVLERISPSSARVDDVVVLHGRDLGTPADEVSASFAGVATTRVLALGSLAVAVVPPGASSGPVTVTVEGVESNAVDLAIGERPAPTLDSVTPAAASTGTIVAVEGRDFFALGDRIDVSFAGTPAALFGVGPGTLHVIVPAGAADGPLVVTVGGRASAPLAFDVTERGAPVVGSLEPTTPGARSIVLARGTDLYDLSPWRPHALPPYPPFGDLRIQVDDAIEVPFPLVTPDGVAFLLPRTVAPGAHGVRFEVNGVAGNSFPLTVE